MGNKIFMNKNIRYEVLCPNCKKGKVLNTLLTVSSWSDELITVAECNKGISKNPF